MPECVLCAYALAGVDAEHLLQEGLALRRELRQVLPARGKLRELGGVEWHLFKSAPVQRGAHELKDVEQLLDLVAAVEERDAAHHLVEDAAQREDVHGRAVLVVAEEDLRGLVPERLHLARVRPVDGRPERLGQAEVRDFD